MALGQPRRHLLSPAPTKRRNEAARNERIHAEEARPSSRATQEAPRSQSLQESPTKLQLPAGPERDVPLLPEHPSSSRKDRHIEPDSDPRYYVY